jgi:hypothetical protein
MPDGLRHRQARPLRLLGKKNYMVRSILSVFAGFVLMAVLVMIATGLAAKMMLHAPDMRSAMKLKPTPAYLAVNLIYSGFFAMAGGFAAAILAGRAPVMHALALAALMFVLGLVSLFQNTDSQQPRWYAVTLLVLGPVCAILGGYLQSLRAHP